MTLERKILDAISDEAKIDPVLEAPPVSLRGKFDNLYKEMMKKPFGDPEFGLWED